MKNSISRIAELEEARAIRRQIDIIMHYLNIIMILLLRGEKVNNYSLQRREIHCRRIPGLEN